MSQSSSCKSRFYPVILGYLEGENAKYWKTLRVEISGSNLVVRISKCRRYMIEVSGLGPLSFGELGGSSALAILVLLEVLAG